MRTRLWVALFVGMGVASSAAAQSGPYLAPAYFHWRESVGATKITESGWRTTLGYRIRPQRADSGLVFLGDVRVYGGIADYDGFLQVSTPGGGSVLVPHQTKTDYAGGSAEGGIGYQWRLGDDYSLTPFASVIGDLWWRGIQGQGGYDELWSTLPLRFGIELAAASDHGWLAGASLKVPVYTQVAADYPGLGWVTVHPKTKLSGDAELGYRFNGWLSLAAFFESYWFGESNTVWPGLFQPETKTYTVGLRTALHFGSAPPAQPAP